MKRRWVVLLAAVPLWSAAGYGAGSQPGRGLRAGAAAVDVTPDRYPVIVNGGFLSKAATNAFDRLHARWLVLDDGATRVAIGVLDTCVIPVEFADEVKARAKEITGLQPDRISLSATHTHSAPSLMRVLGTEPDPRYPAFALPRIVDGLRRAVANLAPARVGWGSAPAPDHTHTRVWIRRPDRMIEDPFGGVTVRANMHPGHQSPDVIGPSGPSDPELCLLAVRHADGRPLAVLANYAMHYFGAPAVSADYYGRFAEQLGGLIGGGTAPPGFVAIMAQGCSGDQHWMDYGGPKRNLAMDAYAGQLAAIAADIYRGVEFRDAVPLGAASAELRLATRQPDEKRLRWAQELVANMGDRGPKNRPEVYAREQLWLKENPVRTVKLQAMRVGELGITFNPCEVFAITSLKIKARNPLPMAMNVELANGEEGYIPPPELHPLGGYNTWPCRSAGLEPGAEPKIADALVGLLEKVSGRPSRPVAVRNGPYARAILDAKPRAYWRLEEFNGPVAADATGAGNVASYGSGVALHLDGPASPAFSGKGVINRAAHLAGGRLSGRVDGLGGASTIELWFWNGLACDARPVTGVLLSRAGEQISIQGTAGAPGRLQFEAPSGAVLTGRAILRPGEWHHLALVRDGARVRVHLDGQIEADIAGEAPPTAATPPAECNIGGGSDPAASFEGKLDEIAIYARALSPQEINDHFGIASAAPPAVAMDEKQGVQP